MMYQHRPGPFLLCSALLLSTLPLTAEENDAPALAPVNEARTASVQNVKLNYGRRVLYIGDSLTVGPFGEALEWSLLSGLGRDNVYVYGSCGSSVESWLAAEPDFITPCGYRETTPKTRTIEDYHGRQKPQRVRTPKVEKLISRIEPEIVIVQLGTNQYDTIARLGSSSLASQADIMDRFGKAILQTTGGVHTVVWITPPDCAKFPKWITNAVEDLIEKTCSRYRFEVIDSRRYTHYVNGVTGGDGIHYSTEPAYQWATRVIGKLNGILPR